MLDATATITPGAIDGVPIARILHCGCCAGVFRLQMDGDSPDVIVRECDYTTAQALGLVRARVLILTGVWR